MTNKEIAERLRGAVNDKNHPIHHMAREIIGEMYGGVKMIRVFTLFQKNGEGWYLLPSIYVYPLSTWLCVSLEIGFTFLRWTFSVDFVWYRRDKSQGSYD